MPNHYQALFANSFDTFKVFDNLTLSEISNTPTNSPKTIWQILNHLITWQNYQLTQLKNIQQHIELDEEATWIDDQNPSDQQGLNSALVIFKNQQQQLADEISAFDNNDLYINQKLKIVQDLSVHLSFHVGEVILMRRMAGTYPLPHQMKEFLN
ncbi:DinB family protein [Mucilaginibacter aquariorum]|uniref:DinB family protein n=1 Tax=Mucilaginibacter aquariorum TaxID=2967225 RepID=A0ABT1T2S9_9SPHI|nr:DinB family protein [Mucilaginibacter aquariorum]MCQ6958920.1 DinB family protein [Mucilaginibacter aquariorum]